jgi:hypothetical protein
MVARVGALRIEDGIDVDIRDPALALADRSLEPVEASVDFFKSNSDPRRMRIWHIRFLSNPRLTA